MNNLSRTFTSPLALLRGLALLATVSAGMPAMAQGYLGQDPELLARYRCSVLGDTTECAAPEVQPSVHVVERVVLGPRAKYLIHMGAEPAAAVAQARLSGEIPVRETVRITTRMLSSAEAFDRANGRAIAPEHGVEVLSRARILVDADDIFARGS
jgi:hypothetical protein